jgi:heme/copper-type cytochrome/quinol oxidase subunit 3
MTTGVDAVEHGAEKRKRERINEFGLWLFFASEVFLFAAFISSRFITSQTYKPEHLNQPLALGLTAVLLASSVSAYMAETSNAHDNRKGFTLYTSVTIVLGLLFLGGVVMEWREALTYFPPGDIYGTAFFSLIGLHAFHVLTGVFALAVILRLGRKGRFGSEDRWPVEGSIKYWHFIDLAWVVIYPTLYLF